MAGGHVPDPDHSVGPGRGELAAAGMERDPVDRLEMSAEDACRRLESRPEVPEPHGRILSRRRQALAVGAEGHAEDRALVAPQDPHGLIMGAGELVSETPDADRPV